MAKNISKILGRKLTGSLNSDEQVTLDKWLGKSDLNTKGFEQIAAYWGNHKKEQDPEHTSEVYKHLSYRLHQPQRKIYPSVRKWQIAASILLAFSIGLSLILILRTQRSMPSLVLKTEKGQKTSALLADGTQVWLNADTELKISDFSGDKRKVELKGEAQFKVSKDANKPFVVETKELNVEVLGTTFNVKAYDTDETLKTTLVEGKVLVNGKSDKSNKRYVLQPGQSLTYYKHSKQFLLSQKSVEQDIVWRKGILMFKSMPFSKLVSVLERNYDVQINYSTSAFNQIHYTGTLDNMSVHQVMEALALSIPMNYNIKKNIITINQQN